MRKTATIAALALCLALAPSLGACGKKADTQPSQGKGELVVTDETASDSSESETPTAAPETAETDDAEVEVVPVTRAQGPLAFVADDELCSILVTGKGHDADAYSFGIEVTNNSMQTISVLPADDSFAVAGAYVPAEFSLEVAPGETSEAVLDLSYTDEMPDASAFEGASISGELQVLDATGSVSATYTVTIN